MEVCEKLLRFLLSELKTVRVRCQKCPTGAAIEVPVGQLASMYANGLCPMCNTPFAISHGDNHLVALSKALAGLTAIERLVAVEFVLPEKP